MWWYHEGDKIMWWHDRKYLNVEEIDKIHKELKELSEDLYISSICGDDKKAKVVETKLFVKGNKDLIKKLKEKGWVKSFAWITHGMKKELYRKQIGEG